MHCNKYPETRKTLYKCLDSGQTFVFVLRHCKKGTQRLDKLITPQKKPTPPCDSLTSVSSCLPPFTSLHHIRRPFARVVSPTSEGTRSAPLGSASADDPRSPARRCSHLAGGGENRLGNTGRQYTSKLKQICILATAREPIYGLVFYCYCI